MRLISLRHDNEPLFVYNTIECNRKPQNIISSFLSGNEIYQTFSPGCLVSDRVHEDPKDCQTNFKKSNEVMILLERFQGSKMLNFHFVTCGKQ